MAATSTDLAALRAARVQLARQDPATFAELVLRDERDGKPIRLAGMHEEWHRLISTEKRLVLWAHVESGKTSAVSVGRVLFELGCNPSLRVAMVSNTHGQACKIVRSIGAYVERSAELREVFPTLKRGDLWRDDALTVERPTMSKDPSVQAFGVHGAVLGTRLDLLILDDILDFESARTETQRQQLYDWVMSTLLGRLTEHGRVIVVGTAFHREDLAHRLAAQGWPHRRYSVVDDTGKPRWPTRWSAARIEEKRAELGHFEAARQLDCIATSSAETIFKHEWLAAALDRGRGKETLRHLFQLPGPRTYCVVGVDLGISTKATADLTAFTTVLVWPDGSRQLLNVEAGRWAVDEIAARIVSHHQRYCGARIVVESVQAQQFVVDLVRKTAHVPCVGFKTGAGKMSLQYQAELLGAELAAGRWSIPNADGALPPEVRALLNDALGYTPAEHCGDRLSSLLMARYGATLGENRIERFRLNLLER